MPDILPSDAPYPRAVLGWDGTAWRVMAVDIEGHVQVDVLGSALPAGAATAANQATMITALQLIDDLRNALESVATDRLQVRGEDQLFSFKESYQEHVFEAAVAAGDHFIQGAVVPAGEVWVCTQISAHTDNDVCDSILMGYFEGGNLYRPRQAPFPGKQESVFLSTELVMPPGAFIRCYFYNCVAGIHIHGYFLGYKMTVEA
ncbi:MAG: hypothetical protein KAX80_00035 [Planctomycetes bacterium]|nr:hypothetical protein [Planctomycetota bacterium]